LGQTWGQPGVNLGSKLGSTCGQPRVNLPRPTSWVRNAWCGVTSTLGILRNAAMFSSHRCMRSASSML
jgi:hypothetical protein